MPFLFNPLTGQLDIVTNADGDIAALQAQVNALQVQVDDIEDQTEKVTASFTTADFVLVVDQYIFTVIAADHLKDDPLVTVYEVNGSDFDEVTASIKILANKDVQLIVPQSPDVRFNGKLIIS
jgi:hypothetical protein